MTILTAQALLKIMPYARSRIDTFLIPLANAMLEFDINTPARQASFLAQVGHESGQLRYVRELASGEAYDTGDLAKRLGNTPAKDGDGERFKGRGLIQITGRANYKACSLALFGDERLLDQPELLEQPVNACRSAGWFWKTHGLNELADKGDQVAVTRRVNGGINGLADRLALYKAAQEVFA
jgi:putative chitinase